MQYEDVSVYSAKLIANIEKVIIGKRSVVEKAMVALYSGGHVLLDDVPGLGKTMLARAIAKSIDVTFKRIQGTPDLLPSDIIGISIYNPDTKRFVFKKGPIFSHILLVDEINRATPKTQSALLEAMGESQISVEGTGVELTAPFFVMATQNPVEFEGTFPLPEAQMDRFLISLSIGYPDAHCEEEIIARQNERHPIYTLTAVAGAEDIIAIQKIVPTVHVDKNLLEYIIRITSATRTAGDVALGASPRGSISLCRASQSLALIRGRDFVIPEDVKELAVDTLKHRLILTSESRLKKSSAQGIIERILNDTPVPVRQDQSE
jgi:MoxR-like ATPase